MPALHDLAFQLDMFATRRAEEWGTRAVPATIYNDAGNCTVVPSYLLSPVLRESSGGSEDIVNEDACLEHYGDVPGDIVDDVLRLLWNFSSAHTCPEWFFVNVRGPKSGFYDGLRSQLS